MGLSKRTDRLMDLVRILRDGRFHRAEDIAARLGVSLRTIYRDMDTLAASGLPIEGLRGLGFQITAPVTLPPLNLTMTELEALHMGLAIVGEAAEDDELRQAAESLSRKVDAVLPETRDDRPAGWGFAAYPFDGVAAGFLHMPTIRAAIRARQKLELVHRVRVGPETRHVIRPLSLDYWGRVWSVLGWCETTAGFREFRTDRIASLRVLPALFVDEEGKRLSDYRSQTEPR